MVCTGSTEIVNLNRFSEFYGDQQNNINKVRVVSPALNNFEKQLDVIGFNSLKDEILLAAKQFPHRRIALTYNISEKTNLIIEIHPVTGAA